MVQFPDPRSTFDANGYEWQQHVPTALQAGLPQTIIDQLLANDTGAAVMSELYTDVWRASRHVAAQENLPDALQQRLQASLGLQGIVELIALCGFYRCIATIVTAFDVARPDAGPPPFRIAPASHDHSDTQ